MAEIKFKGVGRGSRRVKLAGFPELSKSEQDRIGMVGRIGILARSVSNEGCKQRQQHQQLDKIDETGVSGRRLLWRE